MEGALIEKASHVAALSDRELVAHLSGILDVSDDAISSANLEGRLLSWNRGATRLYGWAAVDALTTGPILVPIELRDFEDRILKRVLEGEVVERYDSQRLRKDGSLVEVAVTVSATRDSAGHISGVAQIARDLSGHRNAERSARLTEERLSQDQQLDAAGALAHDFNNLLSIILTYSSLVLEALEPDSPLRSDLIEVCQAAGRAAELTRQLWALGRAAGTARASETILLAGPSEQDSASPDRSTKNCA